MNVRSIMFLSLGLSTFLSADSIALQNVHGKHSKINTVFVCRNASKPVLQLCKIVHDDLLFTDQFSIAVKRTQEAISSEQVSWLFNLGASLLFEFYEKKHGHVLCSVKDTSSGETVFSQDIGINKPSLLTIGHRLSADILKVLTGDEGVCKTSLAYCKMLSPKHKVICLSDYACKKEKILVSAPGINVAPSWHTKAPLLFYSQITKHNNRLLSVNVHSRMRNVICSYNGLNMQPSFSKDGKHAVLCLSGGRGNSELYSYNTVLSKKMGRRVFRQITRNRAHNVSPCMLPTKDIVFCSDYHTPGVPQIYYFHTRKREAERLTSGIGYCSAPSYNELKNEVIYTRSVHGTFQLFSLSLDDLDNCRERQLTFSPGSKHEPSVSPDGRYVVFSMEENKYNRNVSQIAVLNLQSGRIRVLTHDNVSKSYPRWGAIEA